MPAPPPPAASEPRTSTVELLWDLVFVFAITQVTALLGRDLSWAGLGRSLLVLALVWWAWSAFVWAANAAAGGGAALSRYLLPATVAIFITGLAIPHAFGSESTLFAATYAAVRLLHLGLYAAASRRGAASWNAIAGFAVTVVAGMGLLLAGSFAGRGAREALWAIALVVDYSGPLLTRRRLRGLQEVAVGHFAERYGLFVIICLGESIVGFGLASSGSHLRAATIAGVSLGVLITIGMWWTYFSRFAARAEARLRAHADPVLAASDAYSYLHLPLIAGIIVFATGAKVLARQADVALAAAPRLALCGGVAAYLLGLAAFSRRLTGRWGAERLIAGAALLAVFALTSGVRAWVVASIAAALLALLCWAEGAREPAIGVKE